MNIQELTLIGLLIVRLEPGSALLYCACLPSLSSGRSSASVRRRGSVTQPGFPTSILRVL